MIRCLILAVIPALILGCCSPDKWEATQIVSYSGRQPDGVSYHIDIVGSHHVDATKKMAVYNQTVTNLDGTKFVQTIYDDFKHNVQYYVRDGNCMIQNLTNQDIHCVPSDANIVEHSYIGAGSHMIKTTMYQIITMTSKSYLTVADDGCIPVMYETSGTQPDGTGIKMTVELFGVTPGIVDPHIFHVPSNCHKS